MKLTPANQAIRARNVTGSEVGALLGQHPYKTPGQIWDRLMSVGGDKPTSLAMEFGSEAESIMARFAARKLQATIRLNARTYEHPRVRLCATPDALVIAAATVFSLAQPRDLVELKTSWSGWRWKDGLPSDIEWQARAQLAVTHRSRCIVYVFNGAEHTYLVERHLGKERLMTRAVEAFWRDHVLTGIRPVDQPAPGLVLTVSGSKARAS